jgi:hemerythrin
MGIATDRKARQPPATEWQDSLNMGMEQLDAEHRHLFDLVEQLRPDNAQELLEELVDHVVTHFANEHALMEYSRYPGLQQHLALHDGLAHEMIEFLAAGSGWPEERVQALRKLLNRWLVGHIQTEDSRFGMWLSDNAQPDPDLHDEHPKVNWLERLLARR